VVGSVRRASSACAVTLPVAVMLSGCVSTQTTAARARLVNDRVLAATRPIEVMRSNPDVSVGAPVLIRSAAGTAVVVRVQNRSSSALTDLPISVGIRGRAGRKVLLNRSAGIDYFESHVAAIPPHRSVTWVFTTSRRVSGGRPFATVGFPQLHPSLAGGLPRISASWRGAASVSVTNQSAIPQDDLPVYVVAVRGGRDVGAARASVAHLGTHGRATVTVDLPGGASRARLDVIALPTIFS
jgi:hypothetical protein